MTPASRLARRRLAVLFGAAALAGAPTGLASGQARNQAKASAQRSTEVPRVDLARISLRGDRALAPLHSGALAELTLDPDLQRGAAMLLTRARPVAGAIVLVEARSGNVLVWTDLSRSGARPGEVITRAIAPAASVFKIVTTATLLEKARISPTLRVCSSGGLHDISRRHLDPPREGDVLCAPFSQALGFSRNAVYAQLVTAHLARTDLLDMAERFGFNGPVPFAGEVKVGSLDVPYGDLDFARTAIGLRGSTLSPLGALHLAHVVAAGGRAFRLRIVRRAGDYALPSEPEYLGRVIAPSTAVELRRMMEVTVHSGTSLEAFSDELGQSYLGPIRVAGKTGTLKPAPNAPTSTWFTGFAPSRRPEVVVAVLVQNGEIWQRKANEVARDVLRSYFAAKGRAGVTPPQSSLE